MANIADNLSLAPGPGKRVTLRRAKHDLLIRVSSDPRIWLVLITALGFLLRCLFLSSKSFWMDEGFSMLMAQADHSTFFRFVRGGEINMIAYYGLLRLWARLDIGESFIRFLSVLASTATIPVVYVIGKRLFAARVGLLAAALLAIHPSHIAYAQEARSYALAVFLVCLGSLFLLRCLSDDRTSTWVLYAGTMVLAVYSLILTALIPIAQIMVVSRRLDSRRWIRWVVIAAGSLALLLPAIFVMYSQPSKIPDWIPPLSEHMLLRVWRFLTLCKFGFLYGLTWLAALWAALVRRRRAQLRWPTMLVMSWLVVPIGLLIILSTYKPVLIPRTVLMCVPGGVLLAALGVDSFRRPANWILFGVLGLASLSAVRHYYRTPKSDWRGVTALVMAESQSGDAIVVVPAYAQFTVDYYRQLSHMSRRKLPDATPGGQIKGSQQHANRLWLAVYGGQGDNLPAHDAVQSVLVASRNRYCVAASFQFKFVEVFLLQGCPQILTPTS